MGVGLATGRPEASRIILAGENNRSNLAGEKNTEIKRKITTGAGQECVRE